MRHTRPADRTSDRTCDRAANRPPRRLRRAAAASAVAVALLAGFAPAANAAGQDTPPAAAPAAGHRLDRGELREGLAAIHEAGVHGVYSAVRDGRERFDGASGLA
ncbi:hypothetical protein ACFXPJ_42285, partial [Streptomyces goshikiensis]